MPLRDIQQAFSAAIFGQEPAALARLTAGPRQASSLEGIEVYQNNTRERLVSVLVQTYPVCAQLVGERCFDQLVRLHIDQHPCRVHDLDLYGKEFCESVERVLQAQPLLSESVPYLAEMAKAEWVAHRAYFAPSRSSFDFERFSNLTEEQYLKAQFQLAPDVTLVTVGWPIAALWAMHQPARSIEPVSIMPGEQWLVIERPQYRAQMTEIAGPMYETLSCISAGKNLLQLIERAGAVIHGQLADAVKRGWVTGFRIKN